MVCLFYFSDFDEIIVAIRASPVFRPGHMGFCFIKFWVFINSLKQFLKNKLPQEDIEAILNTTVIHIFHISLKYFCPQNVNIGASNLFENKALGRPVSEKRALSEFEFEDALRFWRNQVIWSVYEGLNSKPSLVNASRFWADFGGQNHVVLSRIRRTYVEFFCNDFY